MGIEKTGTAIKMLAIPADGICPDSVYQRQTMKKTRKGRLEKNIDYMYRKKTPSK
ncbi:MAG TPA: hypothetical protein P5042_06405 [Candidatus Izemoplasmatales bacterium]|nr:hypothetical protein [Candidatus Izemoplasmatales bacterium]